MLNYDKYPLNAWVYGLSCLLIFAIPVFMIIIDPITFLEMRGQSELGLFYEKYLSVMLFPKEISLAWFFKIPYAGIILSFISYVIHLHIYCTIIERTSTLLRKNRAARIDNETSE